MPRMLFPNMPVADVARAQKFWTALGFTFDERFTDERAACLVINELANVMLLRTDFFHGFHDTREHAGTEVIMALDAGGRDEVDALCDRAAEAGAADSGKPMEDGPMYMRVFRDPDGHLWEVFHMDLEAAGMA